MRAPVCLELLPGHGMEDSQLAGGGMGVCPMQAGRRPCSTTSAQFHIFYRGRGGEDSVPRKLRIYKFWRDKTRAIS